MDDGNSEGLDESEGYFKESVEDGDDDDQANDEVDEGIIGHGTKRCINPLDTKRWSEDTHDARNYAADGNCHEHV